MLPLLRRLENGQEHNFGDLVADLVEEFGLTSEEVSQLLPSGRYPLFRNRVGWASTYLVKALLIERPRRGYMVIASRGKQVLEESPERIDATYLSRFPEWRAFQGRTDKTETEKDQSSLTVVSPARTPEDTIEEGFEQFQQSLVDDLLSRIRTASPAFFERLVVGLLVAMGYGGSFEDAAQVLGKSGDGGIDGVIKEDRLGLDAIYVQAKRWQGSVGQPIVAEFVGNLAPHRASKGVLITTSSFTAQAKSFVRQIGPRVVLIGGAELAALMIEHGVGVTPLQTLTLNRLDNDYFDEEG